MVDEAEMFCRRNDPIVKYIISPNHILYIHGTVYDIENGIFISVFISELFGDIKKYYKETLHRVSGESAYYFILNGNKYFLESFTRP